MGGPLHVSENLMPLSHLRCQNIDLDVLAIFTKIIYCGG